MVFEKKGKSNQKDIIRRSPKMQEVLEQATGMDSAFDPAGSYTGHPISADEKPVQDADDL